MRKAPFVRSICGLALAGLLSAGFVAPAYATYSLVWADEFTGPAGQLPERPGHKWHVGLDAVKQLSVEFVHWAGYFTCESFTGQRFLADSSTASSTRWVW